MSGDRVFIIKRKPVDAELRTPCGGCGNNLYYIHVYGNCEEIVFECSSCGLNYEIVIADGK
jgi:hypothetical protein